MPLAELRKAVDAGLATYRHADQSAREEAELRKKLRTSLRAALDAQKVAQAAAQAVQEKAHAQVARVVTRCIRTVGWDYDFRIRFERKRGRTEARLAFVKEGVELYPARDAAGGGMVDVAALALRLACLLLATPRRRKLLVLDEPMRGVNGSEYRKKTAELIETLSEELGVQFLISTGKKWLEVGKVIRIGGDRVPAE